MSYSRYIRPELSPQSKPIKGREAEMEQNQNGGYSFSLDNESQLKRFLIIGAEDGVAKLSRGTAPYAFVRKASHSLDARQLTVKNTSKIVDLIKKFPKRAFNITYSMATSNPARLPKMDTAIFVMGLLIKYGTPETKKAVLESMPAWARIPTHLFKFLNTCKDLEIGLGSRSMKRAISNWYLSKDHGQLAYHLAKYRNREGWTHRDVLRIAHPKTDDDVVNSIFNWATSGEVSNLALDNSLKYLHIVDNARKGELSKRGLIRAIESHGLTHEMVANDMLKDKGVWKALLKKMPMTAMIRNLGRMSSIGLMGPLSDSEGIVLNALTPERIKRTRIHPMAFLIAKRQYEAGRGLRGSLTWTPRRSIVEALEKAFYASFENVESTGKRFFIGLDVSGSMSTGCVMGIPGFCPREASIALSLILLKTEERTFIGGFSTKFVPLEVFGSDTISEATGKTNRLPFGGTDCAAPILYAMKHNIKADVFVVYTDNDTWYGQMHPSDALKEYRKKTGINAKLIVNGLLANSHTIADPQDPGMMDIFGFDTSQPQIVREFVLG